MSPSEPERILIIWDRIGDYHRARIAALEQAVGPENVLYADLGGADALYGWNTTGQSDRYFLLSRRPVEQRDLAGRLAAFWRIVRDRGVTRLAIAGYGRPEYVLFILLGRLLGCRITLFAESWYGEGRAKNRLKGLFLRACCHGFLLSGIRAREHFEQRLGIPPWRIFIPYSVVDNDHFAQRSGAPREKIVLCVARFSPEKNLPLLIRSFEASRLAATHHLRIIGGGPQEEALRAAIKDPRRVELAGWVGYRDLPAEYARARFFVLPSRFEPWGLVVNEAMAAGLPVIVSDACGCQPDLVGPANGFVFPAGDGAALTGIFDRIAGLDSLQWEAMSTESRRIIGSLSCTAWARQLVRSFV